jgi:hypothetical protein
MPARPALRQLERLRPMIEESRAALARERARWNPPPTPLAPASRAAVPHVLVLSSRR